MDHAQDERRAAPLCEWTATELQAIAEVELLALDVDGVLTDGRVIYAGTQELQAFDVKDGQGLVWLRKAGLQITWITGRGCAATERRAGELGVVELHMNSGPKDRVLADVQQRLGIAPARTIAMGDDIPDLKLAELAAWFVSPADASPEVKRKANAVTAARGGRGAVRELADAILRARSASQSNPEIDGAHATDRSKPSR